MRNVATTRQPVLWTMFLLGMAPLSVQGQSLTKYLPDEAAAAAMAPVRSVMLMPELDLLPREIFSAATLKEIGIDVMTIEQAMVFATPPQAGPPLPGAAVRFHRATQLPQEIIERAEQVTVSGRQGYELRVPDLPPMLLVMADERTLLAAPRGLMEKMLAGQGGSRLGKLLEPGKPNEGTIAVDIQSLRQLLAQAASQAPPLPAPFQPLLQLPGQVDSIRVAFAMAGGPAQVTLSANSPATADDVRQSLVQAMAAGKAIITEELRRDLNRQPEQDPVQTAALAYLTRMLTTVEASLQPTVRGSQVVINVDTNLSTTGVLVALLLPAVQSAREAARRMASMNNLKQIGLAMHNYHDTHKAFPPRASRNDAGKPLLSWRVHLLPYLEQQRLYEQFHLDEPWDSEHNKALIKHMPVTYLSPNQTDPTAGKTVYLVPDGQGTMFSGKQAPRFRDIRDGTSNTIMTVEADANQAVFWTQPADLSYSPDKPLVGLGGMRPGGFLAGLADGSVRFIAGAIDLDMLRGLMTHDGGDN